MVNGMVKNITTQLKILSLNGNLLTEKSASSIFNLMTRTGLTELNLSNNPLTSSFYAQIKNLRGNTVKSLDLSSTNMDS